MRTLTLVSLLATAFLSFSSQARESSSSGTDLARWLLIPELHARLAFAGYRNIEEIEREAGRYEVKATDQSGRRIKLYVHPQTGAVIDQRQRGTKRTNSDLGDGKSRPRNAPVLCGARRRPGRPGRGRPRGPPREHRRAGRRGG